MQEKHLMTARVSMLLKSRASLTCFRACFPFLVGLRTYQYPGSWGFRTRFRHSPWPLANVFYAREFSTTCTVWVESVSTREDGRRTYRSCQQHVSLSLRDVRFLSPHLMSSLKSNLCTVLIAQNCTETNVIMLYASFSAPSTSGRGIYPSLKMEQCSETSAYRIQTPGNFPEESIQHSEHGGSLKWRIASLSYKQKNMTVRQPNTF